MKKFNFWTLGITAACLCGLTACSDTVSSEDDNIDGNKTSSVSSSSAKDDDSDGKSSGKETKTSSSSVITSCDSLTASLAAPTDLNIVKSTDSTWILLWNYSANDDRPEDVFLIQELKMSDDVPKWKTIDSTMTDVTMYNLKGTKRAGRYYRVSAKDQCGVSKATSMVQASSTGSGSTAVDANLAVPTNLTLNAIGDSTWRLTWSFEDNANRPENGFKIQYLDLSAKKMEWKDEGTTEKGVRVYKIEGNDKRGRMYRVAAKDTNGVSSYSSEIMIPEEGVSSTGTDTDVSMAAPTNLSLDSIGQNKWRLSWKHEDKEAHPENGFRLQKLDLTAAKPQWAAMDTTKKGVRFYIIDNSKGTYDEIFIRIAAKDNAGKLSDFSEEILIPAKVDYSSVVTQTTYAAPTNLKLDTLGFGSYQLSWDYDDNADNGFVLQSLDPQDYDKGWNDEKTTIAKGVHLVILDGAGDAGGKLFRVAALIGAKKEPSLYSTAISIPVVSSDGTVSTTSVTSTLNAPKNLEVVDLGNNQYKLTWTYTNSSARPEDGFKIQMLSGKPLAWKDAYETSKGVYFYVVDAEADETLYRVAAKDDNGTSDYTEEVEVPKEMENPPKEGCVGDFNAPSGLSAERIAPSVWRLNWTYDTNLECLEEGFVIEQYDASNAAAGWTDVGTTKNNTQTYLLTKEEDLNKFYRVAANRGDQLSAYTNEVQITRATAYSADFTFEAPEVKARIYGQSAGYEFSVVVTNNFPLHSIINSPYTKEVSYEFRWNGDTKWKSVKITEANKYSTTLSTDIDDKKALCHSYAAVRIVWEQKTGEKDSTEWTTPVGPVYNDFEYLPYGEEDKPCSAN